MRRVLLSLFLVLLPLAPASAQGQITVSAFSCRPAIPCDTFNPQFPSPSDLIASTSSCVSRYMSVAPGVSIFSDGSGLDSSNCLTTNPQAFPATGAGPTIPHCCVRKFQGDVCVVQCDVKTQ